MSNYLSFGSHYDYTIEVAFLPAKYVETLNYMPFWLACTPNTIRVLPLEETWRKLLLPSSSSSTDFALGDIWPLCSAYLLSDINKRHPNSHFRPPDSVGSQAKIHLHGFRDVSRTIIVASFSANSTATTTRKRPPIHSR